MSRRKSSTRASKPEPGSSTDLIKEVQLILRSRLSQTFLPEDILGFEEEKQQLQEVIRRTAVYGESNSVLITGPRGGGKSVLLKKCLQNLENEEEVGTNLLQVHLNGLLQTDDKIALKEITIQLQLENTLGDKVFGSFAETLQFLLDSLKSGDQQSKPILFVLDEFDMFALHRNQTLLYNLFDVAQSAQTPICVLGLTCRLDVIELLEKRVKSRFSHRQIHLFTQLNFNQYVQVFRNFLTLPQSFPNKKFVSQWNSHVQSLSQEPSIIDILKRQYSMCKEIRELQQLVTYPVCKISTDQTSLMINDFVESRKLATCDSKSAILLGISILELCLIISMKHLMDIYDGEPFNFEMVYNEFQKFAQRKSSMQIFDRPVVLKAYEHLMALELVKPTDGMASKVQKEYRLMTLLIHPSQLTETLQKYPQCPTEVKQWANSTVTT
ncbi:origin recognition complex subunit 4-like [Liolophura sinensis]|uniref:origin recognition complex subunit 4-like n=1 Tax=Liolophura sinensis TaxID=3198878 RepID=UPI0031598A41